jgi:hypothetical protein
VKNALQETASHDAEMSSYSHNEKRNQKHEGAYIVATYQEYICKKKNTVALVV